MTSPERLTIDATVARDLAPVSLGVATSQSERRFSASSRPPRSRSTT
jgi:hypothetical protein